MKTSQEMFDFCKKNGFGMGGTQSATLKHFEIIEKNLMQDEEAKIAFVGLHNYTSPTSHNNNFAFVITESRILMGQKKLLGENFQVIVLENLNDVSIETGVMFGVITFDTIKQAFRIGVEKKVAQNIATQIHSVAFKPKAPVESALSIADQVRELKGLLDDGIILQNEFDSKKKELLGI